jgi:hypothetical protein
MTNNFRKGFKMPVVFVAVLALLGGFALCIVAKNWLQGCEDRKRAQLAREEERKQNQD